MATTKLNDCLSLQRKLVTNAVAKIKDLEAFRENLWNADGPGDPGFYELPDLKAILASYFLGNDDISGAAEKAVDAFHKLKAIFPESKLNERLTLLAAKIGGYSELLDTQQTKARTEDAVFLLTLLNALAESLRQTLRCAKVSRVSDTPGLDGVWLCKLNALLPLETEEGKLAVKAPDAPGQSVPRGVGIA